MAGRTATGHGNASLGGRHFRLDPTSIDWSFSSQVADLATVGGKVIQVFGTSLGNLTVEGTFGAGGWEEQEKFLTWMKEHSDRVLADINRPGGSKRNPPHFRYPAKGWDLMVYLKKFSTPDGGRSIVLSNQIVAPRWSLTFHIVEDNSGLKKIAQDAYLARLSQGIGWKQTKFNGPTGSYGSVGEIQDYLASEFGVSAGMPLGNQDGATSGGGQGAAAPTPSGPLPTGGIKKMARDLMLKTWPASEWPALHELVMRESSWNPTAQNPTSTAYGLFQFLDATWAGVGGTKTSDPRLQIIYGLRYIKNRYGSPTEAVAFHDREGYY